MTWTSDSNAYKLQIDNDISTQSLPNSIPPDVVGSGYTDLVDMLTPYINSINNESILSGTGVPSSGTGNNLDLYFRTQSSYFELYRKESGSWVLKVSVPFGITLPDGPATLRSFITGSVASVTKGGWFISNAVYNKATQTNFTVPAADATFYRTDLIYANTSNQILYLTGTPSLTPADPALPANTIAVDYVIVPSVASGFDPYLRYGSTTESNGLAEQNDTGALTYGGITVASSTTVNIGACTGYVVNNESVPGNPTIIYVNYAGETNKTVTTLGSGIATYVLLNGAGVIVFQNTFPTSAQRKTHIYLSKIGHPAGTITTAGNEVDFVLSPLAQHRDLFQAINYINEGVAPSASGATLNFALSTGKITGDGINFVADNTNPNTYTVAPQPTASFLPRTQTGAGGTFTSTVDVANYDVAGTVTAIPGGVNTSTIQYIYLVPTLGLIVQYGQTTYANLTDAIAAVGKESFTIYPSLTRNAILVGALAVIKSATALNNTTQARFFLADKFGQLGGASAGISTATLQTAYNNSLQPQILTDATRGAVQIKRGSAADTDNVFQVLNGAGTARFSVRGNGDMITPINVKYYGAIGDGVTNDTAAITAALAATDTLYFPSGTYLANITISASNKTIYGDRPSWNGSTITSGTVINGGFMITGSDINISDMGVINGLFNNGFTIRDNAQYVNVSNCLIAVADHGILTQQFGGTCKYIRVLNCDAFGGIHGFVSKAEHVTYENCRSFGSSVDGFAMVSDNFEGASALNKCLNNNLINCEAHNTAIGITIYSRDYFSTTNANNVVLRALNIVGGNINTVTSYAILVGDEAATPGGQTYNDVQNIAIHGMNIDNATTAGIKYCRCNGVSVMGVNTNKLFSKDSNAKNVKHLGTNITTSSLGNVVFNTVLTVNSTSPSVQNGDIYFETANTSTTTIINFSNGKVGQIIWVKIKDTFTTINNGANITMSKSITGVGSSVMLKFRDDASGWDEIISQSVNGYIINQTSAPQSSGQAWLGSGAEALKVGTNTGNPDHAYIGLYARTATPTTRSGSIGYTAAASSQLNIKNEISGGTMLFTTTGSGSTSTFVTDNVQLTPASASSQTWSALWGVGGTNSGIKLEAASDAFTEGPSVFFNAFIGTNSSKTAMTTSSRLFTLIGQGATAAGTVYKSSAIASAATENWSLTAGGSKLEFYTTPNTTVAQSLAMTIDQDGSVKGKFKTMTVAPTTSDIAAGFFMLVKETTGGTLKLYANDGGTIKSVQLT